MQEWSQNQGSHCSGRTSLEDIVILPTTTANIDCSARPDVSQSVNEKRISLYHELENLYIKVYLRAYTKQEELAEYMSVYGREPYMLWLKSSGRENNMHSSQVLG